MDQPDYRLVKPEERWKNIQYGHELYCAGHLIEAAVLEGVDNGGRVRNLCLPRTSKLTASFEKDLLGGVVAVRGEALAVSRGEGEKLVTRPVPFQAVPYYTWDNRQPGPMVVWLPEEQELAELPGGAPK